MLTQTAIETTLQSAFSNERVASFIETALSLSSAKKTPYLNYFGFNYDSEKITGVKIYVAFFHRLKLEEIALLLPDPSDLLRYYDDWEESDKITRDHSGCTFALKISPDLSITNYFHLRIKPRAFATPYFGLPDHLRLRWMELQQYAGISYEYKNGKSLKRLYFYLTEWTTMKEAIKRCNDEFFVTSESVPSFVEYTETENWCKLIHGIDDPSQLAAYFQFYSHHSVLREILHFATTHDLMCVCPGKYERRDHRSIYLIEQSGKLFRQSSASLRKIYGEFQRRTGA